MINEDTQGNVAHLQMEIRRLRDMLTQLQNGSVPHPLPSHTASEEGDHGNAVLQGTEAYEWKNKFMEAMLFRQKSEQEKEVRDILSWYCNCFFFYGQSAVLRPSVHILPGAVRCGAGLPLFLAVC